MLIVINNLFQMNTRKMNKRQKIPQKFKIDKLPICQD